MVAKGKMQRRLVQRKKLLYINSTNSGVTNKDSSLYLRLPKQLKNVEGVSLKSYSMPWTFYNVVTTNNMITIKRVSNGALFSASLSTGHYEIFELISSIQSALNAVWNNTFVFTFDIKTNKINISGVEQFTLVYTTSTIKKLIGLTSDITSSTVSGSQQAICQSGVNLLRTQSIIIRLNVVRSLSTDQFEDTVLGVVPLEESSFGKVISNFNDSISIYSVRNTEIDELEVSFWTADGEQLAFNSYQFSVLLEFELLE